MSKKTTAPLWYRGGLAFACQQCGGCCSGPEEGYVWINETEIEALCDFLQISRPQCEKKYLRKVGRRYSLVEQEPSKDCVFLQPDGRGGKGCVVYPVRPQQCRTWPFWKENLRSPDRWNHAAEKCSGMNQGQWHSLERIESIRAGKLDEARAAQDIWTAALTWLRANLDHSDALQGVRDIYAMLDGNLQAAGSTCDNCGGCCDFGRFGHRLYVTTLEMLYLLHGVEQSPQAAEVSVDGDRCCFRDEAGCRLRDYRTAGCRIFFCRDLPGEFQSELSENVLEQLKQLHLQTCAVYCYADLMTWLQRWQLDLGRLTQSFPKVQTGVSSALTRSCQEARRKNAPR